jgi:AraC-like DNA-binding protein
MRVFYNLPFAEIVDEIVEFQDKVLLSIAGLDEQLPQRLDKYFLAKKNDIRSIVQITDAVNYYKNQISVDLLAQKCNMSKRTLERIFYTNMGIPPKEFISIIRFQQVLKTLQKDRPKGKLFQIAFENGYYDHAHFTREVKKYSGFTPSAIWPGPRFP